MGWGVNTGSGMYDSMRAPSDADTDTGLGFSTHLKFASFRPIVGALGGRDFDWAVNHLTKALSDRSTFEPIKNAACQRHIADGSFPADSPGRDLTYKLVGAILAGRPELFTDRERMQFADVCAGQLCAGEVDARQLCFSFIIGDLDRSGEVSLLEYLRGRGVVLEEVRSAPVLISRRSPENVDPA